MKYQKNLAQSLILSGEYQSEPNCFKEMRSNSVQHINAVQGKKMEGFLSRKKNSIITIIHAAMSSFLSISVFILCFFFKYKTIQSLKFIQFKCLFRVKCDSPPLQREYPEAVQSSWMSTGSEFTKERYFIL